MSRPFLLALATIGFACSIVALACSSSGTEVNLPVQPPPPSPDAGSGSSCPDDRPTSCPNPAPSYAGEVSGIVSGYCAYCHGPNEIAVTAGQFTTYDQIYKDRQAILDQLVLCRMPADGGLPLPEEKRTALLGWLVCGAPNN
jgi:hypothetical protein